MKFTKIAAVAIAALTMAGSAQAATIKNAEFQGDNDCAGYFGGTKGTGGFSACQIFAMDDGTKVNLSPVIVQYGASAVENDTGSPSDTNSAYDTINGEEFTFKDHTGSGSDMLTGDWTYTPGEGDPGMRYWAAKYGNAFRLFWVVDDDVDCNDVKSFACLSGAITVTSGSWSTNGQNGLSHITFYDTEGPNVVVPLPAAGWLMLAGIGGLAAMRRRKKA